MHANCDNVTDDNVAEQYLLDRLSPADRESYERHYFECDSCFSELQRLQTIQAALRIPSAVVSAAPSGPPRWLKWGAPIVGVAASVIAALMVFWPLAAPERVAERVRSPPGLSSTEVPTPLAGSSEPKPEPSAGNAPAHSTIPARAPALEAELLARLARAEPPRYSPSVLRGVAIDDATSAFQAGMKAYVARNFATAVPHLRTAARLDPTRPDFAFFLAAAEFLSGDAKAAAGHFERTIEMGDTPFLEEAHFYLAKTLLKQGDVRGARRELAAVAGIQGELRHDADAILRQLENLDTSH